MKSIFLLTLLALFHLTAGNQPVAVESVSIVRLLAAPEKYQGKMVRVIGFFNLELEGNALYLHEEDYKKAICENGLWVEFSGPLKDKDAWKLSGKYAQLEGRFDMKQRGKQGRFSGAITKVTRLEAWTDPRN